MRSSDSLFLLIESLTPPEKRYFKLFASLQGSRKNYLRLFDAIDAQESYDENALKEIFRDEAFVRQFHVAKHYLYRLILRSLRSFRSDSSIDARVQDLLTDVRILHEKGLHRQRDRLLRRARELAVEFELEAALIQALDLEKEYHILSSEEICQLHKDRIALLRRLENSYELDLLSNRLGHIIFGSGKPRESGTRQALEEIISHPLLQDEGRMLSREALSTFYYIHSGYHFALDNVKEAGFYTRKRVEMLEENPQTLLDYADQYVRSLTNLLVLHARGWHEEEFHDTLAKMRAMPERLRTRSQLDPRLLYRVFNFSYGTEITFHVTRGEFEAAERLVPAIEDGIVEHERYINASDLLRFRFLIAYTRFGLSDYRSALHHLSQALDLTGLQARLQVYDAARLFELIIHYELGNFELLEYHVRSAYRYFKAKEAPHLFERIVLAYFRKIPSLQTKKEIIASFQSLHDELESLVELPLERSAFDHFNYLAWLRSKTRGTGLAEEIRAHHQKYGAV